MASSRVIRLDDSVVNKIAAGEVIVRPASAIKELLENCLDAGATSVTVTIQGGGLKLMQIQDNGCGIRRDDLHLVCERFATSKLRTFEELRSIQTFGFRGEALASVSHVARVTIITAQEGEDMAYKAYYIDGKLAPMPGSSSVDPKPCAGVKGTQINVEDLFYGMLTRRRALGTESDEYSRILAVVGKYAIRNPSVSFTCRKKAANLADLHTPGATASAIDNIRTIYGPNVARELMTISCDGLCTGHVSNGNYNMKRSVFIFFINGRLVDCQPLKRAIDAVYIPILPKGGHPFVMLDITLPPNHVDVNIHPTKQEVRFLHEDKVASRIQEALSKTLSGANQSRAFSVQTLLPQVPLIPPSISVSDRGVAPPSVSVSDRGVAPPSVSVSDRGVAPPSISGAISTVNDRAVRTTSVSRSVNSGRSVSIGRESVSRVSSGASANRTSSSGSNGRYTGNSALPPQKRARSEKQAGDMDRFIRAVSMQDEEMPAATTSQPQLTSILELKDEVRANSDPTATSLVKECTFVGTVDMNKTLIQHDTKLLMLDIPKAMSDMFYQLILANFSNLTAIPLSNPPLITDLVVVDDVPMLSKWSDMLCEYYSLKIANGRLEAVPLLLPQHSPAITLLPSLLHKYVSTPISTPISTPRLAGVNYQEEKTCLEHIAHIIADCYAEPAIESVDESHTGDDKWRVHVANVLLPCLKSECQVPGQWLTNGTLVQIASTQELYRVFERC